MEQRNDFLLIDIESMLKAKMPKHYRYIPRFLINYLKRIIHQEELNTFLESVKDKQGVDFIESALEFLDAKIDIHGKENLPKDGLYTFVSNHPLGGQDGLALGLILGREYDGKVKYLVNDLLMNLQNMSPLFIPINKTGQQSRDFPAIVKAGFESDNQLIMFPAGLCSRKIKGKIQDLEWKKTFVQKSVETKRDVVPIRFHGENSNFFYNLANICKFLGLKVNVAMLYLVDEMFKNRHKTFKVTIGKPIPWQTFDKSKSAKEWASHVRDIVYKLD